MARVSIEDCLEKINNHFTLVLVASHRAQQLQEGAAPKIEVTNEKPSIIALREIAEGLVDEDILNKPLIKDSRADEELAELIAHGLMDQTPASSNDDSSKDVEEEEILRGVPEINPLETGPETIEQMEEIADLNLDHLKLDSETPAEANNALAAELSESELAIGEKLLNEVGKTSIEATSKAETTSKAKATNDGDTDASTSQSPTENQGT